MSTCDFLIIGGGIFGITTAVALAKRNHSVALINPDTIPHHLAASTDISKVVRMEYGSDLEYFRMAEKSIEGWHAWNEFFGERLYHEVGFLLLCRGTIDSPRQEFEYQSRQHLIRAGYSPRLLRREEIREDFPVVDHRHYAEASFNSRAGYAESGRVVEVLARYARSLGVTIHEGQTANDLIVEKGRLAAVTTREGARYSCGQAIVAAGPYTPLLVPELKPYLRATGHPVFWVRPSDPQPFTAPNFSVFSADISNTGWYGFPFEPRQGVVKIGRHAEGLILDPEKDDRRITDREVQEFRAFLEHTFPSLVDAPLVYTRRCLYTDTLDGHFWIDRHPEVSGLTVASGGSGHGFKMAPLLGEMIAEVAEGKPNPFGSRYAWRRLEPDTLPREEARGSSTRS